MDKGSHSCICHSFTSNHHLVCVYGRGWVQETEPGGSHHDKLYRRQVGMSHVSDHCSSCQLQCHCESHLLCGKCLHWDNSLQAIPGVCSIFDGAPVDGVSQQPPCQDTWDACGRTDLDPNLEIPHLIRCSQVSQYSQQSHSTPLARCPHLF